MDLKKLQLAFLVLIVVGATILVGIMSVNNSAIDDSDASTNTRELVALDTFKNSYNSELFIYSASIQEKTQLPNYNFINQNKTLGYVQTAISENTRALYRLKTPQGAYFYTTLEEEKVNAITNLNFVEEGVTGYINIRSMGGDVSLTRLSKNGKYILTSDPIKINQLIVLGYANEGILGYIYKKNYTQYLRTRQVAAHFFYWYQCDTQLNPLNCNQLYMVYRPVNLNNSYSYKKLDWYKNEFTNMSAAGIEIVSAVSWGTATGENSFLNDTVALPLMTQAIQETGLPLKIAYLDDTNSQVSEWNRDQGRGYSNPSANPGIALKMPLSDTANWSYFYDKKMKPFYQKIPKNLWATANNIPVEEGGRPIIMVYDVSRSFTDLEYADDMWLAIRNAFKNDFQTTSGDDIDPFIILDQSWIITNPEGEKLVQNIDGEFIWAGENDNFEKKYTLNDYTTVTVSPGNACSPFGGFVNTYCEPHPRNINIITGQQGNESSRMTSMFQKYQVNKSNLILLETWNELWEGTGIHTSNEYESNDGGFLPNNYYMNLFKTLVGNY